LTAAYAMDWLNLLGRAIHIVTGIAWIGASFYFIWLDNHLQQPDSTTAGRGVSGELWAVHGGGFYNAQKYGGAPPTFPATLHWFKWEAYSTLLSGLFLLAIVYYAQADLYMVDRSVADLSPNLAVVVGIGWIVAGWIVYDSLCRSPLGRNDRALAVLLAALCAAAAYALCHLLPGRAAFMHFGSMLGTLMVLNVFFIIIPGQRELVKAASEGRPIDPSFGLRGKQRSVHNTYFTLPVVFAMLSNHYAWIYGAEWNWVWLIAISAAGALVRTYFVARHRGRASPWPLVVAAVLLAATAYGVMPRASSHAAAAPPIARVQSIVAERCATCHAASPRFGGITAPPKGVELEHAAQLKTHAARIREQVASRAMPPGNVTGLTDSERAELLAWVDAIGHGRP